MSAYSRTRLVSRAAPQRKHFDGQRFGPKLAPDGGRIFQQSSRDIENLIKKKNLTPEQVEGTRFTAPALCWRSLTPLLFKFPLFVLFVRLLVWRERAVCH